VLLGLVAALPWTPIFGLAAYLLWLGARRLRRSLLPRATVVAAAAPPA